MQRRDVSTRQEEQHMQCLRRLIGVSTESMPRSLMAIPCPVMRSGARQAVTHRVRFLPDAPLMLSLFATTIMIDALTLVGCTLISDVQVLTQVPKSSRV